MGVKQVFQLKDKTNKGMGEIIKDLQFQELKLHVRSYVSIELIPLGGTHDDKSEWVRGTLEDANEQEFHVYDHEKQKILELGTFRLLDVKDMLSLKL